MTTIMLIENNPLELKYLTNIGFIIDCFDDNSGFWLVKNIKHKILNKPKINIQDFRGKGRLSVDVIDCDDVFVTIIDIDYSRKNLKKILQFLK